MRQDRPGPRVTPVRLGLQVDRVLPERLDQAGMLDSPVQPDLTVTPGPRDLSDLLARLVSRAHRVQQVHRGCRGVWVQPDRQDLQVRQGPRVRRASQVQRDHPEHQDPADQQDQTGRMELLGLQAVRERQVLRAHLGLSEESVLLDNQEDLVLRVIQV